MSAAAARVPAGRDEGQAAVLLVGVLCAVLFGALILGLVASGVGTHGRQQRAADLGALAAARVMHDLYPRLFEPATLADGVVNPQHLERSDYLARARARGEAVARANGAETALASFPAADPIAPARVRVAVGARLTVTVAGERGGVDVQASADAEIAPVVATPFAPSGDEYRGPLAYRQGKPMRPDVAAAFDRLAAAAAADGITLIISSAYRTNAEQAVLFAAHPDPKWVAPPGVSLHRMGTELDLGPISAYPWLAANAPRVHFIQRYAWEPWHYGYTLNPGSSAAMVRRRGGGDGAGARLCRPSCPSSTPRRSAGRRSAGACRPRCWPPSCSRSPASIPTPCPPRARGGSRSSCPTPPPPTG